MHPMQPAEFPLTYSKSRLLAKSRQVCSCHVSGCCMPEIIMPCHPVTELYSHRSFNVTSNWTHCSSYWSCQGHLTAMFCFSWSYPSKSTGHNLSPSPCSGDIGQKWLTNLLTGRYMKGSVPFVHQLLSCSKWLFNRFAVYTKDGLYQEGLP